MSETRKPSVHTDVMRYELEHQVTQLGTGQFACLPLEPLDFEEALQYVQDHPNDDFMHKYLLYLSGQFGPNLTRQLIERGKEEENQHLLAVMYEACIVNERLQSLRAEFSEIDVKGLARYTPLVYVNWFLRGDDDAFAYWLKLLSDNILWHAGLTPVEELAFPIPYDQASIDTWARKVIPLESISDDTAQKKEPEQNRKRRDAAEVARNALERLNAIGTRLDSETENQASLSPYGLQMKWVLEMGVSTGRNHWQIAGLQTSYGKGLTLDAARASCCMEVAERVSSFASFDSERVLHYQEDHALVHACYGDLQDGASGALDPNDMGLEVPYENQLLYWITGERVDENGRKSVFVPAQLVFLFCNLDEVCLTSGLPSTGLASGNTLEEAKLHALLEVIERDSERVVPFVPDRCFSIEWDNPAVKEIEDRSKVEGIEVTFVDITSELGVPCYKAFIEGPNGEILKGTAANLDGKRAAVSALTEVPYHPSWFQPSPRRQGLVRLREESLPDHSSGHAGLDLERLETLLVKNGYGPIYVNLTRQDLGIPAVKALIPGLELFAEFDQFSRLSLRQFAHYVKACPS
jgi:ribosomal protein S12 methylthiotransferase accessory factor YcaO